MNPEIKALWTAGLRSDEFTKGEEYLTRDGKDCCLGVLCKLAIRAGVEVEVFTGSDGIVYYDHASTTLPQSVMDWAGLDDSNPTVVYGRDEDDDEDLSDGLGYVNDEIEVNVEGYGRIPDLIDAQL